MNTRPNDPELAERLHRIENTLTGLEARMHSLEKILGLQTGQVPQTDRATKVAEMPTTIVPPVLSSAPDAHPEAKVEPPVNPSATKFVIPAKTEAVDSGKKAQSPKSVKKDWRATLRQWQLWPPEDEGNVEIQVGAWWATRIGALLAIIGVVFFGVYAAQHTAPWIRFLQLCVITAGVIAGGLWLERRNPKFGQVIFSAGLALAFFTAFAGHTLPAVQVMKDPIWAGLAQMLIVIAMVACSLWRQRSALATQAVGFGFVTCFFSIQAGMHDFGLFAAGFLGTGAIAIYLYRGWTTPFAISVPMAHVFVWLVVNFAWPHGPIPGFPAVLMPAIGYFVLFAAGDYAGRRLKHAISIDKRRFVLGANLAGALVTGYSAILQFAPGESNWLFLIMAVLTAFLAFAHYRLDAKDEACHTYFIAASTLFAIYLVDTLDARTRWLALGIQSMATLAALRRTRLRGVEAMMILVWTVSLALFLFDAANADYFAAPAGILSLWTLAAAIYLVLAGIMFGLQGRWLESAPLFWESEIQGTENERRSKRSQLNLFYCFALGLAASAAAATITPQTWLPSTAMAAMAMIAATWIITRNWIPLAAAALPFVMGQGTFWMALDPWAEPGWHVWANGLVTISLPLIAATALHLVPKQIELSAKAFAALASGFALFAMVSAMVLIANIASPQEFFISGGLLTLVIIGLALKVKPCWLMDVAYVPVLLAVGGTVMLWMDLWSIGISPEPQWAWVIGAGLAVACALLYDCHPKVQAKKCWMAGFAFFNTLPVIIAMAAVLYPYTWSMPSHDALIVLTCFGVLMATAGWWFEWRQAYWAAGVIFVFGCLNGIIIPTIDSSSAAVTATLMLAAATIAYVAVLTRLLPASRTAVNNWGWIASVAVLATLFILALTRPEPALAYATLAWGLASAVLLITGIAFRVVPLRLTGLFGLALCIPRIFTVDIHSTFYRIAAFAGIGVALLVVGFLYHRFRDKILPPER